MITDLQPNQNPGRFEVMDIDSESDESESEEILELNMNTHFLRNFKLWIARNFLVFGENRNVS